MFALNILLAVNSEITTRGVAIAISGLVIVFVALILISVFIASLPRILEIVARFWPEVDEPHAVESHPESLVADDGHVLAAIGFVLHTEFQHQLSTEQTQPVGKKA